MRGNPCSDSKRLVLRGGYGIYYDRANSRLLNNQILNFPYYTLAQTLETPIATPFVQVPQPGSYPLAFNNPAVFPFGGTAGADAPGTDSSFTNGNCGRLRKRNLPDIHDFRAPYIQQFSLGVQDEFANNWLLDVGYVGSIGRKFYRLVDLNQALAPVPFAPGAVKPRTLESSGAGFWCPRNAEFGNFELQLSAGGRN